MKSISRLLPLLAVLFVASVGAPVATAEEAPPTTISAETSAAEHAEADSPPVIPGMKQGLPQAITTLIAFGIVFFVLYSQVWPRITKGLDERAEKIREEIAAAEEARKQAKDALEEYEKSLSQARAESQKMLEETKAQQAELAAQLRAKADTELNQLRERAKRDIEAAKRSALNEIYSEAVGLASTMASKILGREIGPQDQESLVNESLAEIKARSN